MMTPTIALVVTGEGDPMLPFLEEACTVGERAAIAVYLTDSPRNYRAWYSPVDRSMILQAGEATISGDHVKSVWWRAIPSPKMTDVPPALGEYCATEYLWFHYGFQSALSNARWMSLPSAIETARSKSIQLSLAAELGFALLPTVFTNDPATVATWAAARPSVFKSIRSPRIPADDHSYYTVFTTALEQPHLEDVEGVLSCPGIVQERLDKVADIRVTVIGDQVFAVYIDSQANVMSKMDFRLGTKDLRHVPYVLDSHTTARCLEMTKRLGLSYGAFDFGLTKDGTLIFFEINPNGQWGWLEQVTGLPMRRALLDFLLGA